MKSHLCFLSNGKSLNIIKPKSLSGRFNDACFSKSKACFVYSHWSLDVHQNLQQQFLTFTVLKRFQKVSSPIHGQLLQTLSAKFLSKCNLRKIISTRTRAKDRKTSLRKYETVKQYVNNWMTVLHFLYSFFFTGLFLWNTEVTQKVYSNMNIVLLWT